MLKIKFIRFYYIIKLYLSKIDFLLLMNYQLMLQFLLF